MDEKWDKNKGKDTQLDNKKEKRRKQNEEQEGVRATAGKTITREGNNDNQEKVIKDITENTSNKDKKKGASEGVMRERKMSQDLKDEVVDKKVRRKEGKQDRCRRNETSKHRK